MDNFEAGQPNGVETVISLSEGFESVQTASKQARWQAGSFKQAGGFKMVLKHYVMHRIGSSEHICSICHVSGQVPFA